MAILTISREYGSGGREVGRAAAEQLGYTYVDKDRIMADVRTAGPKWEQWAKNLDEHCPTIWEKYDWSFRGFGALLQSRILEYAAAGNAVIMGRGGNFLLRGVPAAYRIRVTAPREQRIVAIMRRDDAERKTAEWLVEKIDRERECFIRALYGKPWDDPAEYDGVFDAGSRPVNDIVDAVKNELVKRDTFNTGEVRRELSLRALAAKVKAAIATDPHLFVPVLDVVHEGNEIVLRGVTHDPGEHKRIEEAARAVAGAVPVRCDLHYRG